MKKTLLALIALTVLTAACHEQRQDAPINEAPVRAHAGEAQHELQQQTPPPSNPTY